MGTFLNEGIEQKNVVH